MSSEVETNRPAKAMEEQESNKKPLFSCAMKGEWDKVIEMYEKDVSLHRAQITRSRLTALHIAVSDGKEHVVKQMLHAMSQTQPNEEELVKALRTPNERNNTALHLAASMGNATICGILARDRHTLVDDRNADGETPLFLAALHGRKQAFLCLHSIRNPETSDAPFYGNCRRNNGDTILHCAINGDYFDLAFQIIHLYKELANSVNEQGVSPLLLLASKPGAFRSGSRLGGVENIIYHCISVEKLKAENPRQTCQSIAAKDSDGHHECPDNYNTLWDVFWLIRKAFTVVARNKHVAGEGDTENPGAGGSRVDGGQTNRLFPANYKTCCHLIKFFFLLLWIILGKGSEGLRKIYRKKETHTWSVQIVEQLLRCASLYEYEDDGTEPQERFSSAASISPEDKPSGIKDKGGEQNPKTTTEGTTILVAAKNAVNMETIEKIVQFFPMAIQDLNEDKKNMVILAVDKGEQGPKRRTKETPILVAAKNGVMEIIEKIMELFPVAIQDLNEDKKNIVLLAVEHKQPQVYEFLLKENIYRESLFHQLDKDGNNALHLAATLGDYKPWLIPGEALQMHWEHKWYKFVKEAVPLPPDFFGRYNNKNETPDAVFTKTHKELTKSAADWLNKTSESCSLVAALIATVAFATAAQVPGGVNQDTGHPTLESEAEFQLFAISSLIALACSITAMVMFLSVLTSRFQEQDFNRSLPRKLLVGLTSLFMSITSMLVSFCAGHFFVLKDKLHYLALPIYVAACLPVTLFVLAQFPLYFDLLWATFTHVPQRSYRPT